jgi:hypothetical protein
MAVKRIAPYVVGEIGKIGAPSREAMCEITSPNGQTFIVSGRRGWAEVWLLVPGTWKYAWDTGETGEVETIVPEIEIVQTDFIAVPDVDVKASPAALVEILCNAIHEGVQMANRLIVGDTVSFQFTYRHPVTQRFVDPDAVTVKLRSPNGVDHSNIRVDKVSEGTYSWGYKVDEDGRWSYVLESVGNFPRRIEGKFEVDPSQI